MKKIGLIGFGNMGEALASGLVKKGTYELAVLEKRPDAARNARDKYGIKTFEELKACIEFSDLIILAIKPQDLQELVRSIADEAEGKAFISIAAGVTIKQIRNYLGNKQGQVARFMPTLAAKVGASPLAVSIPQEVEEEFEKTVMDIAEALGTPYPMKEELISAFIGISGSGIAYLFEVIHALSMGGVREGLPYNQSLGIVLDTFEGAAKVLKESQENPAALTAKVTSPAGTTIEGIKALAEGALQDTLMEAVHKAAQRSRELEK